MLSVHCNWYKEKSGADAILVLLLMNGNVQDWALGVLHAKIITAVTMMGPQWRLKHVIEQVSVLTLVYFWHFYS